MTCTILGGFKKTVKSLSVVQTEKDCWAVCLTHRKSMHSDHSPQMLAEQPAVISPHDHQRISQPISYVPTFQREKQVPVSVFANPFHVNYFIALLFARSTKKPTNFSPLTSSVCVRVCVHMCMGVQVYMHSTANTSQNFVSKCLLLSTLKSIISIQIVIHLL